jgi:hypothetical protein
MDWTDFEIKKEPASYPSITIYNDQGEDTIFDYETFMQSFLAVPSIVPPKLKGPFGPPPIEDYTVVKMDMITIQAIKSLVKHQTSTCTEIVPPTDNTLYYMNNRRMFLTRILDLVKEYRQVKEVTCDSLALKFELLPHQKLARSYINVNTPYRGLLLYHGLGSGKTCTAIAISENIKAYKQIVVMTPKSLEMNFLQELKKCGDSMYSLQQTWKWTTDPTLNQLQERCLSFDDLFKKDFSKKGIWINVHENSNFDDLIESDQESIKKQIDIMIRKKYEFVIYNGNGKLIQSYASATSNQFSNKLIIIDEAHNLVTRIVNKLATPDSLSCRLYKKIMEAENCKIVMLTGTPMINQAHEIAVLFNMLRGYMYTWTCKSDISEEDMRKAFPDMDTFKKTHGSITFTQLQSGFVRPTPTSVAVYQKNYESSTFSKRVAKFFKGIDVTKKQYTALPDDKIVFNENFIDNPSKDSLILLQHRITGLASYFPDLANLMPVLHRTNFIKIEMTPFQYNEYIDIRIEERKREKPTNPSLKKGEENSSTYRINSRLICNTTYPPSARALRPKNKETEVSIEGEEVEEVEEEHVKSRENFFKAIDESDYCNHIKMYSPKYDSILQQIKLIDSRNKNQLHLLYSQFLNIEGIKLFSKVLDVNGYTEFKLKRTRIWKLDVVDKSKKMYMIYGGSKISVEQKELFRNIFNKNWEAVPAELRDEVKELVIPLFMITSAGAEGISLKQVQNVHIMEPYWNPIRIDQVIGRARRICSHTSLPKDEQYVNVFMYIMVLPVNVNPMDVVDDLVDGKPGTTDEFLQWNSTKKRDVAEIVTTCIKNASIDYSLRNEFIKPAPHSDEILLYEPDMDLRSEMPMKQSMGKLKMDGKYVVKVGNEEDADHYVKLYTMDDVLCGYAKIMTGRVPPEIYTLDKEPIKLRLLLANRV